MNKLTAEVARRHQRDLKSFQENPKIGLSLKEELYLQALEIALPILEQQERGDDWIKCSEQMPEIGSDVLVYMDEPIHCVTPYAVDSFDKYGFSRSRVIAWQPLPSPPEEA